jgi:hypothetical protein
MTEDEKPVDATDEEAPTSGQLEDAPDSRAMRSLLQRSLPEAPKVDDDEILHDVQRTIRKRSRGKFYGDGWSTSQSRTGYALVAVAIVMLIALAWFGMVPGGLFGK